MVYFIFSPDDPRSLVKIGYTKDDVAARMAALQVGVPFRLVLIMALEGGKDVEGLLHRKFHRSRCHGEWFHPTADLREFIRAALGGSLETTAKEIEADEERVAWLAEVLSQTPDEVLAGLATLTA